MSKENKWRIRSRRYDAIHSGQYTGLDRKEELQSRPKFRRRGVDKSQELTYNGNIKW